MFQELCEGLLQESDGEDERPKAHAAEAGDGTTEGSPASTWLASVEKKTEQQRRREKAARKQVSKLLGSAASLDSPLLFSLSATGLLVVLRCALPHTVLGMQQESGKTPTSLANVGGMEWGIWGLQADMGNESSCDVTCISCQEGPLGAGGLGDPRAPE
jgi:hypothetical protein